MDGHAVRGALVTTEALVKVLFRVIAALLEESRLERGVENELKNLDANVRIIGAVLGEAEKMHPTEPLKLWLAELKDVFYDAMEILDECSYEAQRRQVISLPQIRNGLSVVNPARMQFRHGMGAKIKYVTQRMYDIGKMRQNFISGVPGDAEGSRLHQTSSLPPVFVSGRENDQKKIVDMLVQQNDQNLGCDVAVLPVLGEGYIGKTTVAQLVYNDESVSRHFEPRLWVHVSHEFSLDKITATILESLEGYRFNSDHLDTLQRQLQKQLQGRRYLLVLDNFSNESWHDWEKLKLPLLKGAAGSKIIATTRRELVARVVGTLPPYHLHGLSDDECWGLLCRHALGAEGQSYFPEYDRLREEILNKCKGIPFAAISLGHRLHLEKDRSKWTAILEKENWEFLHGNSYLMQVVRVSYEQLESRLRPCFAYCSIIPQELPFEEEWIIQCWMAQGFIQPDSTQRIEDIGSSYFSSLLDRSFFQHTCRHHGSERHTYTVSDMMHELAVQVSAEECCILKLAEPRSISEKVRHLTLVFNCSSQPHACNHNIFEAIYGCKGLHTLLAAGGSMNCQLVVPDDLGKKLSRLRTLDLSSFGLTMLPKSIGKLKHLRCLQLRSTDIKRLPDSICSLYNLQVLGLRNCYYLEELPRDLNHLRKLRHLDLHLDLEHPSREMTHSPCRLRSMPKDIGLLTHLQTLSRFVISKSAGCRISELNRLDNLHGELVISNLHLVKHAREAAMANLARKQFLRKLAFSWSNRRVHRWRTDAPVQILQSLEPATSIKELIISGYVGARFPSWLGSASYSNLVKLRLYDFNNCSVLPRLGRLPLLKDLYIGGMDGLSIVSCDTLCCSDAPCFPSLTKLHLESMNSLTGWHGDDSCALPSLLELVVKDCVNLQQITHSLPSLTKLMVEGSPYLIGLRNFPSLKHIDVNASGEWIWRSWPHLASPFSITLSRLPTISIPRGSGRIHRSLQRLDISHCEQLSSMPDDWPPCNLTYFTIRHCPQLRELPKGISGLQTLEDLDIQNCGHLTYLPELIGLTSLLRLEISDCSSLSSLPSAGLPDSLQFLSIDNCPVLGSRCRSEGSPDWVKIAHIFSVWIDKQQVFTSADEPRFVVPAKLLPD